MKRGQIFPNANIPLVLILSLTGFEHVRDSRHSESVFNLTV